MESWQFIQSPAGEWYWLCSNVISRQTRTSAATFQTHMECVANAMASGYQKIGAGAPAQSKAPPPRPATHPKAPNTGAQPAAKRAQRRNRNKSGKRSKSN